MDDILNVFVTLEQLGVAHNDVIKRHILLTRNPDPEVGNPNVVLIDFGEARTTDDLEELLFLRKHVAWNLEYMLEDRMETKRWLEEVHHSRQDDPVWDEFLKDARSVFSSG